MTSSDARGCYRGCGDKSRLISINLTTRPNKKRQMHLRVTRELTTALTLKPRRCEYIFQAQPIQLPLSTRGFTRIRVNNAGGEAII
ncbi:hypothetical protein PUN28_005442 [Cardiocondyla obscurior]|uniref:Uncharacterized protein n=1 Tax=Cardiocondyla obscurior TaxID=286306 RepID=A0AAW2GHM6_9HYME